MRSIAWLSLLVLVLMLFWVIMLEIFVFILRITHHLLFFDQIIEGINWGKLFCLFLSAVTGWVQPNKNYQAHSFFFLNLMSKYKDPETSSG
jgi:hypothetical protein